MFVSGGGGGNHQQPQAIMPGGAAPGAPLAKPKTKVVVALYNYKAIESGDLSLEKNQEYEVIDDSQEHWWKVKDSKGYVNKTLKCVFLREE